MKVYDIPEGTKTSKGRAIQNLLNIGSDDKVKAFVNVKRLGDADFVNSHYLMFCTKNGVVKKTRLEAYSRPRQNGVNAIVIREDDEPAASAHDKRQRGSAIGKPQRPCNPLQRVGSARNGTYVGWREGHDA